MTVVDTTHGRLRGSREDGLAVFRGVPFAAPPTGQRRWLPPEPPEPWPGVRDALAFGNASPQEKSPLLPPIMAVAEAESEDCLYLNVWTPATDGVRPVLFWIHGGGFCMGAGSEAFYDGRHLAARDVVVVTINYRMGAFGFVHLHRSTSGAIPATGNEGLLDQVAALEWVRDNIAAFGGDPGNVTIFGESAGGMSVASLLTMPKAKGLFHKAIVQSGPGHTNFSVDESVGLLAEPMLAALGDRDPRLASTEEAQAALPSFTAAVMSGDVTTFNHWAKPVVDGQVVTDWPEAVLAAGTHAGLPLMIGTTRDEMARPLDPVFEDEQLLERVQLMVPAADASALVDAYRSARGQRFAPTDARSLCAAIQSHKVMTVPSTRLLDAHRAHGPVYHYIFDWISPGMDGANGASHGTDIGFVFGTHEATPEYAALFGAGPAAGALASATMDAWCAFARSGDPSSDALGRWPTYGAARETMMIGPVVRVFDAPFEAERRAWDDITTADMR